MLENNSSLQFHFLNKIKDLLPQSTSLVHELADLLEVSTDSAYRRIRSETPLTFDEIIKICRHYKVSFDPYSYGAQGSVTFNYNVEIKGEKALIDYLNKMLQGMELLEMVENKQVIYAAEDIPIFHHIKYPEIGSFKYFYWLKSVMNVDFFEDKKYHPDLISDELTNLGKEILDKYASIPSIEIWTEGSMNSIIKQIKYYWDSGFFNEKADVELICGKLKEEIEDIKNQAKHSSKFADKKQIIEHQDNYKLYVSDIEIGNNYIFVNVGDIKTVYLRHHTFNSMFTTNPAFCDQTENWLNGLMQKSNLISGVSEKQRNQFFNVLLRKIDELSAYIEQA